MKSESANQESKRKMLDDFRMTLIQGKQKSKEQPGFCTVSVQSGKLNHF